MFDFKHCLDYAVLGKCNILRGEIVQSCVVVVYHIVVEIVPVLFATSLVCCVVQPSYPPKQLIGKIKTKPIHKKADQKSGLLEVQKYQRLIKSVVKLVRLPILKPVIPSIRF